MAKRKPQRTSRKFHAGGRLAPADVSVRVSELFSTAVQHHQSGRLGQAEPLYQQVLALDPRHIECLHNLGILARQIGRNDIAADLFGKAVALDDQIPSLHSNLAAALKVQGKPNEAVAAYQRAIALKPDLIEAHYNLGNLLRDQGKLDEAVSAYQRVLALKPDLAEAHYNLGGTLMSQGRADEAAAAFQRAIAVKPDYAEAYNNLGAALKDGGRLDEAVAAFQRAIALKPDSAEAHANLSNALKDQDKLDEAAASYQRAIALKPDLTEAHHNLGVILGHQGKLGEAAAAFQSALDLKPDYAEAHYNLGVILAREGRLDEAAAAYQRAIALKPDHVEALLNLAGLRAVKGDSPEARAMVALLDDPGPLEPKARSTLLFAMSKALESQGEFDRAFDCMAQANAIHRASSSFDLDEAERRMASIAKVFDAPLLDRLKSVGLASDRPIFIVGMPRSGTTLVEQIISAHPQVHGAGEIPNWANAVTAHSGGDGLIYPFWASAMTAADCRAIGQTYLDSLPAAGPGQTRVTDKMVTNFEGLGLIHLCLPHARIIHCQRDPRDVCLSCFSIRFSEGQEYAYDLAELGRYWRAYDRLMAHWRAVLPSGRMLEVPYEAVVEDVEGWARRLIVHCGLEWDDACLRFYESKREVRTASLVQVRQPIYTGSVGRWRAFAPHLSPLLEALSAP